MVVLLLSFVFFLVAAVVGYNIWTRPVQNIDPNGKVVVVTGAAGGLGSDLTRRLLKMGAKVIAHDIKMEALQKQFPGSNPNLEFFACDISELSQVEALATFTKECLKKWNTPYLFCLVNMAGIARTFNQKFIAPMVSLNDAEMLGVFGVNIFAMIRCTNALYPLMKHNFTENKDKESPIIVNIASLAGIVAPPFFNYYTATKFAAVGYSDSLRRELAHAGVRVSCIKPGFADTNIVTLKPHDPDCVNFGPIVQRNLNRKTADFGGLMKPSKVTDAIVTCMFSSNETYPVHYIVEPPIKFIITMIAVYVLPRRWLDAIIAK
ncbi:retinol dehydrogenase [Acrasis kona]|uniref:Retinol dehydrogenase n=1 Tax=Acrasis kona TaxID=1008807 RepID=A0AAW2Z5H5_9EUKA